MSKRQRKRGGHLHVGCECEPRWLRYLVGPNCPECRGVPGFLGAMVDGLPWLTSEHVGSQTDLQVGCSCGCVYAVPVRVQALTLSLN